MMTKEEKSAQEARDKAAGDPKPMIIIVAGLAIAARFLGYI